MPLAARLGMNPKNTNLRFFTVAIGLSGMLCLSLGGFGCSAAEAVDQETDCQDICSRYADCFDRDYDVSGCQKRCVDRANKNEDVAADIEQCDSCLDRSACSEVVRLELRPLVSDELTERCWCRRGSRRAPRSSPTAPSAPASFRELIAHQRPQLESHDLGEFPNSLCAGTRVLSSRKSLTTSPRTRRASSTRRLRAIELESRRIRRNLVIGPDSARGLDEGWA
jgi:hypothetical protein